MKRSILVFITFFLLACLYFWRNLTPNAGDRLYLDSDFLASFYPTYLAAIERIKQGDFLPLWDTTQYLGMPFFASIHVAFFYPFHLIFYFGSALLHLAWTEIYYASLLMIIGQLALAGVFTYYCTRRVLNLGRAPSFIAGLIYTFCEVTIASVNTAGVLESLIWLPLLLLLLHHLLEKPSSKSFAIFSLIYAVGILAGYPYTVVYNTLFLTAYVIFWNLGLPTKKIAAKEWGLFLGSIAFSATLSAIQLFPSFELARQSYRRYLGYTGSAFSINIDPAHLIDYLFPLYFYRLGGILRSRFEGVANYVGVMTLILAFFSFHHAKHKRWVIFFFSTFFFSLLMSMGGHTFLNSLFYLLVPFYSKLRTVAVASYLTSFSLALLAALGLERLQEVAAEERKFFGRQLRYLATFLLVPAGLSLFKYLEAHRYKSTLVGLETLVKEISMFNFFLIFAGVSLAAIFGYLFLLQKKSWLQMASAAIIILDLFSVGPLILQNNSPIHPASFYNKDNEIFNFLSSKKKSDPPFRVDWDNLSFHYNSAPFNLEQIGGYQALALEKISSNLLPFLGGFERTSNLKKLLNVKYLVTNVPLDNKLEKGQLIQALKLNNENRKNYWVPSPEGWDNPPEGSILYLYELGAWPRFYVADNIVSLPEEKILPHLAAMTDTKTAVVQNDPLMSAIITAANQNREPELKATIRTIEYRPEKVALEVKTNRDGLLIFNETYFPGWKAFIDNQETKIIPANFFMKSVPLTTGSHRVTFIYQPVSFYVGATMSAVGTVILIYLLIKKEKGTKE